MVRRYFKLGIRVNSILRIYIVYWVAEAEIDFEPTDEQKGVVKYIEVL